jgi:GTP cyclohydrolase IA
MTAAGREARRFSGLKAAGLVAYTHAVHPRSHPMHKPDPERIAKLVRQLLVELGENPRREGLRDTPERVARSFEFLTSGYRQTAGRVLNGAIFESQSNDMIILRDIEVYSLCEHHMLPFFGRCHVGYVARDRVVGVSKIARLVDCFARRLQVQERLTAQIAEAVMKTAAAEGVGVVMECRHLCMMMRGVQKQNSVMTTSSVLGTFRRVGSTRSEFLSLIHASGRS